MTTAIMVAIRCCPVPGLNRPSAHDVEQQGSPFIFMPCYRTHDQNGQFVGILCGRLGPACVQCGDVSAVLCDFPLSDESRTCDRPLCERCAPTVGADKNYCAEHKNGVGLLLFPRRKLTEAAVPAAAMQTYRKQRARRLPKKPPAERRWRVLQGSDGAALTCWMSEIAAARVAREVCGRVQTWDEFVIAWRTRYPRR